MKLPQLSLRDLFWLVLVCGLAFGWWVDRRVYLPRYSDHYHALAKEYLRVNFRYEYIYAHADRSNMDAAYEEHPDRPLLVKYFQENQTGKRESFSNFLGAGIALVAWVLGLLAIGLLWRGRRPPPET